MDVCDDEKYLPNLDNDRSCEQIVFDQKVFRANEVFMKLHQDIINWYFSPPDNRCYLKCSMRNKNGFRMRCHNYVYDESKAILYKKIKCNDGISKYLTFYDFLFCSFHFYLVVFNFC